MFVAYQKKKENICESFLYMFQIEDIIRACKLNRQTIEQILLPKYPSEPAVQTDVRQWYFGLADQMEEEHIEQSGMTNEHDIIPMLWRSKYGEIA